MAQSDEAIVEIAKKVLDGIQTHMAEQRHEHSLYMTRCKGIKANIKALKDKAKDEGIKRAVLNILLNDREHRRKQAEAADNLEIEDKSSHEFLRDKLGDYADLPLGQAALGDVATSVVTKLATKIKKTSPGISGADLKAFVGDDDDTDLRPAFLIDKDHAPT